MNKSNKELERYKAPIMKSLAVEATSHLMSVSIVTSETPDLTQDYSDWD